LAPSSACFTWCFFVSQGNYVCPYTLIDMIIYKLNLENWIWLKLSLKWNDFFMFKCLYFDLLIYNATLSYCQPHLLRKSATNLVKDSINSHSPLRRFIKCFNHWHMKSRIGFVAIIFLDSRFLFRLGQNTNVLYCSYKLQFHKPLCSCSCWSCANSSWWHFGGKIWICIFVTIEYEKLHFLSQ
jgi:hypothetical protein